MAELPQEAQYPTQGATVFVDLERREVRRGYTPMHVVRSLLAGRGANMFYLHRLLDESLQPLHPDIPLVLTAPGIELDWVRTEGRHAVTTLVGIPTGERLRAAIEEATTGMTRATPPTSA